MPFIPFRPHEKQFSASRAAIVATPATVQENQAQLVATDSLPVATVTQGNALTVAGGSRTVATGNADRTGTIATLATIADPPPENVFSQARSTSLRFFLDRANPPDTAQALAWLLDSLPHNPHLTQDQRTHAQAALHWLAEEEYRQRCYILFAQGG